MKVVFLETVEGSGTAGEVRDVANGYARNFLLPRGLAAPATPQILRQAERLAAEEDERQQTQDEQAQRLVGKLQGQTLVMPVRVGEQGRLYGSVTNVDIAEKAGEILGGEVDRRRILLPEVIRQVGVSTVSIRLSRNVTAEVQVVVVDAEAPEGVDAAAEAMLAEPAAEETIAAVPSEPDEQAVGARADGEATDDVSELGQSAPVEGVGEEAATSDADPGDADLSDPETSDATSGDSSEGDPASS